MYVYTLILQLHRCQTSKILCCCRKPPGTWDTSDGTRYYTAITTLPPRRGLGRCRVNAHPKSPDVSASHTRHVPCNVQHSKVWYIDISHVGPDPTPPHPNPNSITSTPTLPPTVWGARGRQGRSRARAPPPRVSGALLGKKNAGRETSASTNQTEVLHEFFCKMVLPLGPLLKLGDS